jgi:hypothetical protein
MILTSQLFEFCDFCWKFIVLLNAHYPKFIDKAIFFHYT